MAVGNVEAAVLRPGGRGTPASQARVPLRGGVVGARLPPLRESTAPLGPGDVLVVASDGMVPAFLDAVDLSMEPPALARRLHAAYARADDDALVLVARCVGPPASTRGGASSGSTRSCTTTRPAERERGSS